MSLSIGVGVILSHELVLPSSCSKEICLNCLNCLNCPPVLNLQETFAPETPAPEIFTEAPATPAPEIPTEAPTPAPFFPEAPVTAPEAPAETPAPTEGPAPEVPAPELPAPEVPAPEAPAPEAPATSPPEEAGLHPPHIHAIDVQCAKDMMTITIEFDKPYDGIIYSKVQLSSTRRRPAVPGRRPTSKGR